MPLPTVYNNGGQAGDFDNSSVQLLVKHITSLYKKDCITKPSNFSEEKDIDGHLKEVDEYCNAIEIDESGTKCCILRETLPMKIRNQFLFEPDFKTKNSDYAWHSEKLKSIFPSSKNQVSEIVDIFSIKQNENDLKTFMREIKDAVVNSQQINESDRQHIALDVFLAGLNDKNLSKAISIKKPKSIDEAFKIASTVRIKKENNINFVNCNESPVVNSTLVEIGKQLSNLTQLIMALMERFSKNNQEISTKRQGTFTRNRNPYNNKSHGYYNRNEYNNKNSNDKYVQSRPANRNIKCFRCGRQGHVQSCLLYTSDAADE